MAFAPLAIAAASLVAGVAQTAISISSSKQQAAALQEQANYRAKVAQNNQIIEQQNARYATAAARENAFANDLKTKAILGQQEAAQGASGLDLTSGSPEDVRESTRPLGRLGTLQTYQQGALQAYGYQSQAANFGAEAGLQRLAGADAARAGRLGATASLLGGVSSVSDKYLRFQGQGIFG